MKGLAVFVWIASVMAALFFAPSITAITTIAIVTMLLCAVLVLVDIRDNLAVQNDEEPAAAATPSASKPSGQVGMFSTAPPRKSEES
jgi:hypothetical protein